VGEGAEEPRTVCLDFMPNSFWDTSSQQLTRTQQLL
jgi:hypothetical protein